MSTATITRIAPKAGVQLDTYRAHQLVERVFESGDRSLFRMDPGAITVIADTPPALDDNLHSIAGWDTRPLAPLLASLHDGARVWFRLRANPTRSAHTPGTRGRRFVVPADQRPGWFLERLQRAGLGDIAMRETGSGKLRVTHRAAGSRSSRIDTTIAYTDVEGLGTVTDPETLRHTIRSGIGRKKFAGMGLLLLAPTPSGPK